MSALYAYACGADFLIQFFVSTLWVVAPKQTIAKNTVTVYGPAFPTVQILRQCFLSEMTNNLQFQHAVNSARIYRASWTVEDVGPYKTFRALGL